MAVLSVPVPCCVQVLVAACQQEVQEVIRLCTNSRYTDLLFVAHSFEVMRGLPEASRVISRPLPHMGCDQAESFMLNYAEVRPQLSVHQYPPCGHILLYCCACCCAWLISQHSGLHPAAVPC